VGAHGWLLFLQEQIKVIIICSEHVRLFGLLPFCLQDLVSEELQ
jgi:hypothetical protein